MDRVQVRIAKESDVASIERLQQQWCDEDITWGFTPDTPEGIRSFIEHHCFVAELEGELVGYITGQELAEPGLAALPDDTSCMEVVDLYVAPSNRSQGIGSLLLRSLMNDANAAGIGCFRLHSGTKDIARTVSFYERHGFSVAGVCMVRMSC